jgi:uncharacterized membrane protein
MSSSPALTLIAELAELFDLLGVAVLVLSALVTCGRAIHVGRVAGGKASYLVARRTFGKALLLALEVLIAADLMRSVSLNLTISSVMALGLLVVVRPILSADWPARAQAHRQPSDPARSKLNALIRS